MEYRSLGKSGLKVSAVSLGGWINFEAKIPEGEAQGIIRTAYESGVNFYDLADVYGNGRAEEWMGGMLKQYPRHTLVVSTKVAIPMSDDSNDQGLSRKHIMESIDRSLKNLRMEYVDLYFCHRSDPDTPILETARTMDDLIHAGKVLYWGTSMWSAEQIQEAVALCEKYHLYPPQVDQPIYSMLRRDWVEQTIASVAQQTGMGLTVYSPLAMGMLTGKYDAGIPEGSRFDTEEWSKERYFTDENVERVKRLRPIAHDLGLTRSQLALAWTLQHPAVSSVITGATKVRQIEDNVQAAGVKLSADVMRRIDAILAA